MTTPAADLRTESIRCWCGHPFVHTFPAAQYPGYDSHEWQAPFMNGWCDRCRRSYKGRMHRGPVPPWGMVVMTAPALRAFDVVRPHAPELIGFGLGVLVGLVLGQVMGAR